MKVLWRHRPTKFLRVLMNWENDWYLKHPIAHRGLHSGTEIPENSLSSFQACIDKKLPIELDVHILTDGTALVFHDDSFERMTGYEREMYMASYDDVKSLRLIGSDEHIPTLEQVLTLVNGQVPLVIELKCLKHDGRLEHQVNNLLQEYDGPYCIQSFNPYTLLWFKRYAPNVTRGLISGSLEKSSISLWQKVVLRSMLFAFMIKPHYIAFEWDKFWYPSFMFIRLFTNIPVIAWCIRNKNQQMIIKNKCENIIFEDFDPV